MADVSLRMTRFIFNPHANRGDTVLEIRGRPHGLSAAVLNFLRLNRQSYLILDDTSVYFRSVGMGGLRDVIYTLDKVSGVQSGVYRSRRLWWGGLLMLALGVSLSASLLLLRQPISLALMIVALGMVALLGYLTRSQLVIGFTTDDQPAVNTVRFVVPKSEAHHVTRETLFQVIGYINLVSLGGQVDRDAYVTTLRLKPINVTLEAEDEIVLRVVKRPVMTAAAASAPAPDAVMDDLLILSPTEHWATSPMSPSPMSSSPEVSEVTETTTLLESPAPDVVFMPMEQAAEDDPQALEAPLMTYLDDEPVAETVAERVDEPEMDDTTEAETIATPASPTLQSDIATVGARPAARSSMPTTAPFVEIFPEEPVLRPNPRDTAEQIAEAVSRGTGILPSLPSTSDSESNDTRPVPSPAIKPVTSILRSAKDLFSDGRTLFDEGEKLARSGLVDESQAKFRAAVALLTKAIEIDPNYYKSFGGRAKCYEALGDDEKAEQDWMLYRTLARTQGGTMSLRPPGM